MQHAPVYVNGATESVLLEDAHHFCLDSDLIDHTPAPAEEYNSARGSPDKRNGPTHTHDHGARYRAGQAERTQSVSDAVPNASADPACSIGATMSCSTTEKAVGFDIETTGINEWDIVTVACVWSPTKQATCFHGDDFAPVLSMLDDAALIYTYNGMEFDLPRLAKHCGRNVGSWMRKTVDPHYIIRHAMGFGGCLRLSQLLVSNGFEPKSGCGLQAIQFWKEGNREALSSYCMDDARLTFALCEKRSIVWGEQSPWRIHLWEDCVMHFKGKTESV